MNRIRGIWLAALAALAFLPCSAFGQAVYGSIYGTVTDATGALIPNAPVVVTDTSKGTTVTVNANESGEFRVDHLIPDVVLRIRSTSRALRNMSKITSR